MAQVWILRVSAGCWGKGLSWSCCVCHWRTIRVAWCMVRRGMGWHPSSGYHSKVQQGQQGHVLYTNVLWTRCWKIIGDQPPSRNVYGVPDEVVLHTLWNSVSFLGKTSFRYFSWNGRAKSLKKFLHEKECMQMLLRFLKFVCSARDPSPGTKTQFLTTTTRAHPV